MSSRVIVSACLLGRPCRYDGAIKTSEATQDLVERIRGQGGEMISVCPEELGGLGTPRPAAELRGGDGAAVLAGAARVERISDGQDVTAAFLRGARRAWSLGRGAETALLKARSPSCGCGEAHRDGGPRPGDGVFAALLRAEGVEVMTDEDILSQEEESN